MDRVAIVGIGIQRHVRTLGTDGTCRCVTWSSAAERIHHPRRVLPGRGCPELADTASRGASGVSALRQVIPHAFGAVGSLAFEIEAFPADPGVDTVGSRVACS